MTDKMTKPAKPGMDDCGSSELAVWRLALLDLVDRLQRRADDAAQSHPSHDAALACEISLYREGDLG
jgi:hypothetical protein